MFIADAVLNQHCRSVAGITVTDEHQNRFITMHGLAGHNRAHKKGAREGGACSFR